MEIDKVSLDYWYISSTHPHIFLSYIKDINGIRKEDPFVNFLIFLIIINSGNENKSSEKLIKRNTLKKGKLEVIKATEWLKKETTKEIRMK
jgi:hypothetical protein